MATPKETNCKRPLDDNTEEGKRRILSFGSQLLGPSNFHDYKMTSYEYESQEIEPEDYSSIYLAEPTAKKPVHPESQYPAIISSTKLITNEEKKLKIKQSLIEQSDNVIKKPPPRPGQSLMMFKSSSASQPSQEARDPAKSQSFAQNSQNPSNLTSKSLPTKEKTNECFKPSSSRLPNLTRFVPLSEKYVPKDLSNIIGNIPQVSKLRNWLEPYTNDLANKWHLTSQKKVALLSGPPGVGKTTSVRLIAASLDLPIIELNASDCRNKSFIEAKIAPFVINTSIVTTKKVGKSVLVMDEIDGMSGGDEGGISALIDCIKCSKVPIICICNDPYTPALRSLKSHCFEVKFSKPNNREIKELISHINKEEEFELSEIDVDSVTAYCAGDIRFALNILEFYRGRVPDSVRKDQVVSLNSFEVAKNLLSERNFNSISLDDKVSMFLGDYDFISMLLDENYLRVVNQKDLPEACSGLVLADCIMTRIKTNQEWTLLPDFAFSYLFCLNFSTSQGVWPEFPNRLKKKKDKKDDEQGEEKSILEILNRLE